MNAVDRQSASQRSMANERVPVTCLFDGDTDAEGVHRALNEHPLLRIPADHYWCQQ